MYVEQLNVCLKILNNCGKQLNWYSGLVGSMHVKIGILVIYCCIINHPKI